MNIHRLFVALLALLLTNCALPDNPVDFVDPFIGTDAHGHTHPSATYPFGMVQAGPINGRGGWDWCSGYHYSDSLITGFTQTHLSGTGACDLNDILIMPVVQKTEIYATPKEGRSRAYTSGFSHEFEKASPGYYSVLLLDEDIKAEMTVSERVALYRFTYPEASDRNLILDLGYDLNWDWSTYSSLTVEDDRTLTGSRLSSGWANDQRIYFVIRFSEPFELKEAWQDSILSETDPDQYTGTDVSGLLHFPGDQKELHVKIAISGVSVEGAKANVKTLPGYDFDITRMKTEFAWFQELEPFKIEAPDETKRAFYTALYHTKQAPQQFTDADGKFRGGDGKTYEKETYDRTTIYSLWDTYRAQHPLLTITNPDRVNGMITSMLGFYQETGLLPVWELVGNETNTMTGYHAVPVIVDAYLKGFRDYDTELAYEAIKASAMQNIRGTHHYREYGYLPSDKEWESVTITLEYAFDDWCIAQMAQEMGKTEEYDLFMKRAGYWANVFDSTTGFMRGKNSDGAFAESFDPFFASHRTHHDYTEGTAWQHNWYVPHQVPELIEAFGGEERFITKLDSLFIVSSIIVGENASPDISGMIGQYAHGNEPSHHIVYMYNFTSQPWKTQYWSRTIMDSLYTDKPDGLSGNEDVGQMSAWYVFSALGFYPMNPANGRYQLGSPAVQSAIIELEEGKQFSIVAQNWSPEQVYVASISLNGKRLERTYITHEEVMAGGELVFEMTDKPVNTFP
ncbi:MAG: GH92 family glycosyl hydrolase [Bacteroidota bacterium]